MNVIKKMINKFTTKTILELIEKRAIAKSKKNFELADAIREELLELGIEIKDSSDGTKWTIKS